MKKSVVVRLQVGQLPSISILLGHELIRVVEVSHLHVVSIPIQFGTTVVIETTTFGLTPQLI